MAFVRHYKLTLLRAVNINSTTVRRARTKVTAKASLKNLVYATTTVEDMGTNPVFENDGTNVFHFDSVDESGCFTLELFNRNNESIGVSKLPFKELVHLLPGKSEKKVLPVIEKLKQFGELELMVEIEERQAMGKEGLLTVELREGIIQGITSILRYGTRTTKISAKLMYKHTTYTSGILEKMGNRFVWHEDNIFTFIINSLQPDEKLQVEVYNFQAKVGNCEIRMSSLIEEKFRADPSELHPPATELLLANKPVGSIVVTASFTRPICDRRNSSPQTQHPQFYPPPHPHTSQERRSPTVPQPTQLYPPQPGFYSPEAPQFNASPSFHSRLSAPPGPEFYPPGPHLKPSPPFDRRSSVPSPELYPPGPHVYHIPSTSREPATTHLHPSVSDPGHLTSYQPSAPVYQEVHHSRGFSDTALLSEDNQKAPGAPAGIKEKPVCQPPLDDEVRKFIDSFHFTNL